MDVEMSVREFLRSQVRIPTEEPAIASDESLLDNGLLDSAGIFQLVTFLEERFGFVIPDEELVPENFDTINSIVAFVNSHRRMPEPDATSE